MSFIKSFCSLAHARQALVAIGLVAFSVGASAQSIVVASTTSTEQSGLFGYLLPEFKKASGIDVKVVALGTTEAKRSPLTADIPALGEHKALKGIDIGSWFVLMGPARLPDAVVARLKTALAESLKSPDFRKKMEASGSTVAAPGGDIGPFLQAEVAKYQKIVQFAKIEQ